MQSLRWTASSKTSFVAPILLFLGVFAVYLGTAERESVNVDAYAASAGAWRIATAGTPWFDGLDVTRIDGTHKDPGINRNGQWISESPNGHVAVQRMMGPIVAGVPFYLVLGDEGTTEADFELHPAAFASSFITAIAVCLLFLAVRRYVSIPVAVAAALAFAFATPTWTVSANGLWTHPITQLGLAGTAYAASRKRWWLGGIFLGVGMLGRPHLALVAAVFGFGMAFTLRDWKLLVKLGLPTTLSLGVITLWSGLVHGTWLLTSSYGAVGERAVRGVEETLGHDLLANYAGFLVSFNRGILVWTPVVLVFVPAVFRARKQLPPWTIWLALGACVYTFVQIRLANFTGGIFFYGYRHGLELITALVPVLAISAPYLRQVGRLLTTALIGVQIGAMTIGAVFEGLFIAPEFMWSDNSLWRLLRYNPVPVGGWLLFTLALGLLVGIRHNPRVSEPTDAAAPRSEEMSRSPR
jgi:hypothetical protein